MSDSSTTVPRQRWPIIAVAGVVVAAATYLLAVRTGTGQAIENAALRGADQASERDANQASHSLDQITVYSLAFAVLAVAAIAIIRRRCDLLVAGAGVIVAGQVVVQTLERYVLPRPELVDITGHFAQNSLPSGHGAVLWGAPLSEEGVAGATREDEWDINLGATAFASAGSVIAALVFLAAWHRLDTDRHTATVERAQANE